MDETDRKRVIAELWQIVDACSRVGDLVSAVKAIDLLMRCYGLGHDRTV